ncbi:hypothetical protein Prudu_011624 [Prunus dulcis]|uniref:Uncharacterized protein n=1 Tax=Prunus dulcis TaxID=3755 RepID=A0A4Y1RB03_PRUDU|nr:hypothetical protein Prudu_011624 [Prunus dulcis]
MEKFRGRLATLTTNNSEAQLNNPSIIALGTKVNKNGLRTPLPSALGFHATTGHVSKVDLRKQGGFFGKSRLLFTAPIDEEDWKELAYERSSNSSLGGKINPSLLSLST